MGSVRNLSLKCLEKDGDRQREQPVHLTYAKHLGFSKEKYESAVFSRVSEEEAPEDIPDARVFDEYWHGPELSVGRGD